MKQVHKAMSDEQVKSVLGSSEKINTTKIKKLSDKIAHIIIVTFSEVALGALAIQGMLSVIHTTKKLQVVISVAFVAALFILRFRSK